MNCGVPQAHESLSSDSFAASRRPLLRVGYKAFQLGLLCLGLITLTPGTATAQPPSTRSYNKPAAFTGRVRPARA
jgi:hypothetical protein